MKGDFSKWGFDPRHNFDGVLHQQGRVFLDSDWNEEVQIKNYWQHTAGRDMIGSSVAAIPAEVPDSFKVVQASVVDNQYIQLTVKTGRAWVNGHLIHLESPDVAQGGSQILVRIEDYIPNPDADADISTIVEGIRDAVILEVWQEAINGFQMSGQLIEPALGGPDTTERMKTCFALRLLRLAPEDNCRNLKDKLNDNPQNKGKLKVSLKPVITEPGECPTFDRGGYTGFEHNLYRIEIARLDPSQPSEPMFKWSQYNGGLVGRGNFDVSDSVKKINITDNLQAITSTNLDKFYLEVIEQPSLNEQIPDEQKKNEQWQVIFGAEATLNGNTLEIPDANVFYNLYTQDEFPTGNIFFRLWNGIKYIKEFPKAENPLDAKELQDGIRLEFDPSANATWEQYRPQDYWTFPVRVGQTNAQAPLLPEQIPQGIHYHRVPLAILKWNNERNISEDLIRDCRHTLKPITSQKTCCTLTVGDGMESQGDFNSLEEALNHLPDEGGQICMLPGVHKVNVTISERSNIRITGCGIHTILHPHPDRAEEPIITIINSLGIQIDRLTLVSFTSTAIKLNGEKKVYPDNQIDISVVSIPQTYYTLRDIYITENYILAFPLAIQFEIGNNIKINQNHIVMFNKSGGKVAIYLKGENGCIEKNMFWVVKEEENFSYITIYNLPKGIKGKVAEMFSRNQLEKSLSFNDSPFETLGGIQIGSYSNNIKIIKNNILGGKGHGICLGALPGNQDFEEKYLGKYFIDVNEYPEILSWLQTIHANEEDSKNNLLCKNLLIEDNEIAHMGLNGIGVRAVFNKIIINSEESIYDYFSLINSRISRNYIHDCASQIHQEISTDFEDYIAFGGIVLMDVENIIINNNHIEYNGINYKDPICGIFLNLAFMVDISWNIISDNGYKDFAPSYVQIGYNHGGLVISNCYCASNIENITIRIYDNKISQPFGRALVIFGFGNISVCNNHFRSNGLLQSEPENLIYYFGLGYAGPHLIGTVCISRINFIGFSGDVALQYETIRNEFHSITEKFGSDFEGFIGSQNSITFANNHITLFINNIEKPILVANPTSIFILSNWDVTFFNNFSEIFFTDPIGINLIIKNTEVIALSMRIINNLFQENVISSEDYDLYSLKYFGKKIIIALNQAKNIIKTDYPEYLEENYTTGNFPQPVT